VHRVAAMWNARRDARAVILISAIAIACIDIRHEFVISLDGKCSHARNRAHGFRKSCAIPRDRRTGTRPRMITAITVHSATS